MTQPARRTATYADVLAAPDGFVAEVMDGELHLSPRPAKPHAAAASALGEELGPPFKRGKGGPGGWIIIDEPELHLGADIVVPDLGGWRVERMPELVDDDPYFNLAPDWICEVLSPRTAKYDRTDKLAIYAREQVRWAWLVDPLLRTLEALKLDGTQWRLLGTWRDEARLRAEPFDAIELELGALWQRVVLRER
ncbi:MAG TPA: Uma2 family endonuclease [Polyangiaceae bacterium]|nr:Uma2 family endonuclease [Polyangiaceae bacterium]